MKTMEERFLDSFYAGVYGDILGSVYEFLHKDDIPQNLSVDMILQNKTNVFKNPVGTFTDDTILMLCAMASFNETGYFDAANQMKWIGKYILEGVFSCTKKCFDIGHSTLDSYDEWESNECDIPQKNQRQGNGVLMRLAPYAYYCAKNKLDIHDFSVQVTDLTHSKFCYETTEKMMTILVSYYKGEGVAITRDYGKNESVNGHHWGSLNAAVDSLDTSVTTTILNAIKLGGDTDTNACIAGQIAGAMYGIDFNVSALNLKTDAIVTLESFIQLQTTHK